MLMLPIPVGYGGFFTDRLPHYFRPPLPQSRLEGLRERLAEEVRGRAELEAAHQDRVKDLHKRLQAEHLLRWVLQVAARICCPKGGR